MQIVVKANPQQKTVFQQMLLLDTVKLIWYQEGIDQEADAYFNCCFDEEGPAFEHIKDRPVFVSAMLTCCNVLPDNIIRFNAWNGFLAMPIWEIAAHHLAFKAAAESVLVQMNKAFAWVPDRPGLITAGVISMIINEAFFALGDGVSNKTSIDIAMKLGTNYPNGPFEWADMIGIDKIIGLLNELNKMNDRYQPAPKLLEALSIIQPNKIH
jgi:3-hydroxybutyryl-CoA dehydrogenase